MVLIEPIVDVILADEETIGERWAQSEPEDVDPILARYAVDPVAGHDLEDAGRGI